MKSKWIRLFDIFLGLFIFGILGIFGMFVCKGGNPVKLIVLGELIFITLLPCGVCILAFGSSEWVEAITGALFMIISAEPAPLTPPETVIFRAWGMITYLGGFVSGILGFVITMGSLNSDWGMLEEHIIAVTCAFIYALLFNVLFIQPILCRSEWLLAGGNKEPKA